MRSTLYDVSGMIFLCIRADPFSSLIQVHLFVYDQTFCDVDHYHLLMHRNEGTEINLRRVDVRMHLYKIDFTLISYFKNKPWQTF